MRFLTLALVFQAAVQLIPVTGGGFSLPEPFVEATRIGSVEMIALMIQEGADVNEGVDGWTPLHEAAREGHLEVIDLLLVNGANPLLAHRERVLPIMVASKHGHVDIVRKLAEHHKASPDSLAHAMIFAAFNARVDVVEYLISRDANLVKAINDGFSGEDLATEDYPAANYYSGALMASASALAMASVSGNLDIVSTLVHHGASPDFASLAGACFLGHAHIINFLIDNGGDVNKDWRANFVITEAVRSGRPDVVELLIRRGARRGFNQALLSFQIRNDSTITKLLLEYGANPNTASPDGTTRLLGAVLDNRPDIVRLMLDYGADPRPNTRAIDPVRLAMNLDRISCLFALVEAGYVKGLEIPADLDSLVQRVLILGGASNTGNAEVGMTFLMRPITVMQPLVSSFLEYNSLQGFETLFPSAEAMAGFLSPQLDYQGFIALAFEARKAGADLLNHPPIRASLVPVWTEPKLNLVSSMISESIDLECTELNFLYTVAPFLASATEDMLSHTLTAFNFLTRTLANVGKATAEERQQARTANGPILNEMIERSHRIGLRPVVKALFAVYSEEWQNRRIFESKGLPQGPVELVVDTVTSSKDKAMRKLMQAMRRLQ